MLQRFLDYINTNRLFTSKDKLLLAVSGGADSVVLTELCKQAGFYFIIAHCNFQLRGEESNRDEEFVRRLAEDYRVPFCVNSFDTKAIAKMEKRSVEETARELRYSWFHELLDKEHSPVAPEKLPDFILTGHHADDNIETVVMNFFRGTGIKGMRGILPLNGRIVRPLLFARRQEIVDYAEENLLEYVTDSTNVESLFTRNYFRNEILPAVIQFFPGTDQNIINNINRLRDVEELYTQAIDGHKKKLFRKKGKEIHIPVLQLKKLSPLKTIVYEIIQEFGFTAHQTDEVIHLFDSDSGKYISSATHRIIKHRHWLIISPVAGEESANIIIESTDKEIDFALGKLCIESTSNLKPQTSNHIALLDSKQVKFPLLLRKWKTGDYFYPLGMKKKKKLSRFFIDQKLSKTQKENAWVIESKNRIIWVVGQRIDERFKITEQTGNAIKFTLSTAH